MQIVKTILEAIGIMTIGYFSLHFLSAFAEYFWLSLTERAQRKKEQRPIHSVGEPHEEPGHLDKIQ